MKKSNYFFILPFLFFVLDANAYFKNVTASALGTTQAFISWTVGAGTIAGSGYEVQWSTDSFTVSYSSVYTVPTICGASGVDEDYNFTHTHPNEHKKNYYRLYSPQTGFSTIVVVDLGAINGYYVLFPNPVTDYTYLTFENPNNEQYILDVVNAKGLRMIYNQYIYNNQIALPKSWFENGIYYFRLFSLSGNIIRGKFVVVD